MVKKETFPLIYTARHENLYTFVIDFISEFVQIFTPRPVDQSKLEKRSAFGDGMEW